MKITREGKPGNSIRDDSDDDVIQSDEYLLALAHEARAQQSETVEESMEQNSNRLRILELTAGVAAVFTAGMVVDRLSLRYGHAH